MQKPGTPEGPDEERAPRRLRLHPREAGEHRYGFARRWEARRRARQTPRIWMVIGLDVGALLLVYLVTREVIRRLAGG